MYVFIINPSSGKGEALAIWHEINPILIAKNISYETHICISPELTRTYMIEKIASQSIRAFIVIGGDGTVSSALQQLVNTNIPLAILPAGSGNDIARNCNLVGKPVHFVEKLIIGETKAIDLLYVNGLYGITVVGVGMDAKIGMRADRSSYKKWLNRFGFGSFTYTIAAIIELMTFKPYRGSFFVDGSLTLQTNLWLVANGNMKMYGGGLIICPFADPQDGLIDVTILHNAKRWNVMTKLFPKLLKGHPIFEKEVTYLKGKDIKIEGEHKLPYIVDGEIFFSTHIHLSIQPRALKLVVTS
ncbi:diacylglycerol/lipid kinase family protein [Sporosarcina sp. SAFN-015]|uniref:diacylglycerol/lipid kinase family protein n=1 Tax=Sporosarcina sp. SAFN-015 TaxID=3387274 RepID=UPI003F7F5E85